MVEADSDLVEVVATALAALHPQVPGMPKPDCSREASAALAAAGLWLADRQAGWGFLASEDLCCKETASAAADLIAHRTGA